jgi:hypothetical protein
MSHGVSVKSFYVCSRTMSSAQVNNSGAVLGTAQNFDQMGEEYGRSDTDIRHRSQSSIIWEPNYFANRSLVTRALLDGWTLSGIVVLQSGTPFSIQTGVDNNFDGNNNDRASGVPNQPFRTTPFNHSKGSLFFNPAAFCGYSNKSCLGIGPGGSDGNTPRNNFSGPTAKNINAAIFRNFKLGERVQLQGRVEATNIFNTANLSIGSAPGPNVGLNSSTVGTITTNSSSFPMRQLQVGARILF